MDAADAAVASEAEPTWGSLDAEAAATRIVSNLPAVLRGSPALQANPSCDLDDESGSWDDTSDEDDDIDIDELAEDMAVLEEELEQGAIPPTGFPNYMHGEEDDDEDDDEDEPDAVYPDAFLADELDPDDDVGLYVEDDDGFLLEDGLADLEDTESEDLEEWEEAEWEEGWGPGAANDYHRNLIRFRHAVEFLEHRYTAPRRTTSPVPRDLQIPFFWRRPHDEEYLDPEEEENPAQESFFSRAGQSRSQWYHLSAASNHFQSADSLSAGGTPSCSSIQGSQDEEIVMLHNTFCLALWRLPAASAAASSAYASASCPAPAPTAPVDTATSSAATSASAPASSLSTLAAATSAATSAKPSAEPSATTSGRRDHTTASHQQFKSCHSSPISEDADAVLLAFTYPRYRIYSIARSPDGRFVAVGGHAGLVSIYEVTVNPDHEVTTAPSSSLIKLADPQLRARTLQHNNEQIHRDECPLLLQLVTHIALENLSGVVKAASMANCVRFGLVGDKMRLLVAGQSGGIYIFEVGPGPLDSASKGMPCQEVIASQEEKEGVEEVPQRLSLDHREVLFMSDQQLSDMHHKAAVDPAPPGEWGSFSSPAHTVVLRNHMGAPCNCAMASPDGNWIAVVGDTPSLLLLHISEAYDHSKLPPGVTRKPGASKGSVLKFGAKQPRRTSRSNPRNTGSSAGSQYCCWNSDSSLVALSSDFYQAVMVFDVHRKQQVLRFEDQPSACLPVTFAPWDPQLLVFAEAMHRVYITDLRNVAHARQRLVVSDESQGDDDMLTSDIRGNIRGMAVTPGGRLLLAHADRLVQWSFLRNWVPEEHKCYPARLKEAAALLLLTAAANPGSASPRDIGSEFGLHSLPKEVLLRIFGLAAFPLGMWMTGLPQVKITEGLPEKPLALETLQEQHHASKS